MPSQLKLHFHGHEFLLPRTPPNEGYDTTSSIEEHAAAILSNLTKNGDSRIFSDIAFYLSLKRQYPYSNISICKVSCWHKMYIHVLSGAIL